MYGGAGSATQTAPSAVRTAPVDQTQSAPALGTSLDGTSINPETGAPIDLPVPGQDSVNDVAARVGNAVVEGWRDTPDFLTPEAQSWLAKAEENNPRPNAQDVLTVGHAVLAAGNAVFRGGLEGIAAFGDAVGQPELGRDVAGYYEAMGMTGAPHMPGVPRATMPEARAILTEQTLAAAKVPQQDAIAAIGAAPDVDSAIAAAAKAVAVPGESDVATKVADALEEPPAPAAGAQSQLGWSDGLPAPTDLAALPAEDAPAARNVPDQAKPGANDTALPQAQSVGAAASSDLDPGVGDLTPEQELAHRSTAEGQKLLEPQPYGISDNTAYVPGVTPNAAEIAQTVDAARELKTLKTLNPDISSEAAGVLQANNDARQQHFAQ